MKKLFLLIAVVAAFVLVGCSSRPKGVESVIKVGKTLKPFTLNDQFEKPHTLTPDVKKIIFVFAKKSGHTVRKYFNTKPVDYLKNHHYVFVADVSGMPSIIYKMFAKSDLQKHKYPIWLIFDSKNSAKFVNEKNEDKIMVVTLDNLKIKKVQFFDDVEGLKKAL